MRDNNYRQYFNCFPVVNKGCSGVTNISLKQEQKTMLFFNLIQKTTWICCFDNFKDG